VKKTKGAAVIDFICNKCNKKLQIKDEWAGKKAKCPICGNIIAVPTLPRALPLLSTTELELLFALSRRQIDSSMAAFWTPHVGPFEKSVNSFIQNGLLSPATFSEKLESKFKVADLQRLLKDRGVMPKGKKADLVSLLVKSLPENQLAALVAEIHLFRATPLGRQLIENHLENQRQERAKMEAGALVFLNGRDVLRASGIVAEYEARKINPRGLGIDWCRGMPQKNIREAEYLVNFLYEDLPFDAQKRRKIGAALALSIFLGESAGEGARRLLVETNNSFSCKALEEFLRTEAGSTNLGIENDHDLFSPGSLAFFYAGTRMFAATAQADLNQLVSDRVGKGIKILNSPGDGCKICARGKLSYRWSEIDQLQKIPRHWGCTCCYCAWF
jgi:ribosomal protein S27E